MSSWIEWDDLYLWGHFTKNIVSLQKFELPSFATIIICYYCIFSNFIMVVVGVWLGRNVFFWTITWCLICNILTFSILKVSRHVLYRYTSYWRTHQYNLNKVILLAISTLIGLRTIVCGRSNQISRQACFDDVVVSTSWLKLFNVHPAFDF